MELFMPIVLFIVFCVLFSICGWCCKKHRQGTVYGYRGNTAVTVTTQPASAVVPPYPIDARHPQPQNLLPPTPGFVPTGYQNAPYPTAATPYPPAPGGYPPATPYPVGTGAAPYPPATGYVPSAVAPYSANGPQYSAHQQPPSYHEAIGQLPAEPQSVHEGYVKQSPYNPNY